MISQALLDLRRWREQGLDLYVSVNISVRQFQHHELVNETFQALNNVSFAAPAGSTFGVIGRNGSGKSTALKLVAGITKPTSGVVRTRGRISALIELGAGVHPEI